VGVAHVTRDERQSEVSALDATPHLVQQLAGTPEPLTRPLLIEEPVVQGACEVHRTKPGTAQVTCRQIPVVGQLPQPPGLLKVVVDIPEVGESVIGVGAGLDGQCRLQVARGSVEVASKHRLPTGDDEAMSRGRPHEPMIGPPPAEPLLHEMRGLSSSTAIACASSCRPGPLGNRPKCATSDVPTAGWQLRWLSGTASHTVRVGHPMGQDDVWHAHAAKEHALRQPPCPDHLLDPGLGANWPHCQVR